MCSDDGSARRSPAGEFLGIPDEQVLDLYQEIRNIAHAKWHRHDGGTTLQPTALAHEAILKVLSSKWKCENYQHAIAVMAQAMFQVMVDRARHRNTKKRGGDHVLIAFEDTQSHSWSVDPACVLELEEMLASLRGVDPEAEHILIAHVVGGMRVRDLADALGMARSTVSDRLQYAKGFLRTFARQGND